MQGVDVRTADRGLRFYFAPVITIMITCVQVFHCYALLYNKLWICYPGPSA